MAIINAGLFKSVLSLISKKDNIDTIISHAKESSNKMEKTYKLPGYATEIEKRDSETSEINESEKAFIEELKSISTINVDLSDEKFKTFFYKLSQDNCRKPFGITKSECSEVSDSILKLIKSVSNTTMLPKSVSTSISTLTSASALTSKSTSTIPNEFNKYINNHKLLIIDTDKNIFSTIITSSFNIIQPTYIISSMHKFILPPSSFFVSSIYIDNIISSNNRSFVSASTFNYANNSTLYLPLSSLYYQPSSYIFTTSNYTISTITSASALTSKSTSTIPNEFNKYINNHKLLIIDTDKNIFSTIITSSFNIIQPTYIISSIHKFILPPSSFFVSSIYIDNIISSNNRSFVTASTFNYANNSTLYLPLSSLYYQPSSYIFTTSNYTISTIT